MNAYNPQRGFDTPEALSALANEALGTPVNEALSPSPSPTPAPGTSRMPLSSQGRSLNDDELLTLMRICSDHSDVLREQSKSAFLEQVSANFEITTGRTYAPSSCKRIIDRLAATRRAYLNQHQTGRADGTNTMELDELVDEYIETLEELSDRRKRAKMTAENQKNEALQDQLQREALMTGLVTSRDVSTSSISESPEPVNIRPESSKRSAQRRIEEQEDKLIDALSKISDVILAPTTVSTDTQLSMRIGRLEEDLKNLKESVNNMPNQMVERLEAWFRTRGN